MVRFTSSLLLVLGSIVATSCATTKDLEVPAKPTGFRKEVHVHQTNGIDILTELDRDYWIETRKETKEDKIKLYSSLGTREWDVAIGDARAYLENHPGDYVALKVLSTALAMKKNYSLASYYGRMLEKLYPGQAETKNIMGLAILHKPGASYQDFQKATRHFESAFESDERQIASGLNLGHLHLASGNSQAALDVFNVVKSRCGGCSASLYGMGLAASRLKDFPQAKSSFEEILKREPRNTRAKYYLALVETYGFNKKKDAVKILAEVLEDKDGQDLEVKRQANFLKRRIEAQIYAQKRKRTISFPSQENQDDKEEIIAKDNSPKDEVVDPGNEITNDDSPILPAADSELDATLE